MGVRRIPFDPEPPVDIALRPLTPVGAGTNAARCEPSSSLRTEIDLAGLASLQRSPDMGSHGTLVDKNAGARRQPGYWPETTTLRFCEPLPRNGFECPFRCP